MDAFIFCTFLVFQPLEALYKSVFDHIQGHFDSTELLTVADAH